MAHRAFITEDRPAVLDRARQVAPLVGVGFALLLCGWLLLRPTPPPVEATLPMAGAAAAATSDGPPSSTSTVPPDPEATTPVDGTPGTAPALVVQAAGAVAHPGVYRLTPGSRIVDLVEAAGGLTGRADRQRVNLAAPLSDGERVWLPERGQRSAPELVAGASGGSGGTGAGVASSSGADGGVPGEAAPVDLNAADAAALDALPGIGPATAAAILAQREAMGGFRSVDDLLEVRGIGEAKLEQLRPLVRV